MRVNAPALAVLLTLLMSATSAQAGLKKLLKKAVKVAVVVVTAPVTIPVAVAKESTKEVAKVTNDLGPIGKVADVVAKVAEDASSTTKTVANAIDKNTGIAFEQTSAELHRSVVNVGEAGDALKEYYVATVLSQPKAYLAAARKIREKQFTSAIWQLAYSPVKDAEANAAQLTASSSLVNIVATVGASVYGGPQGAAAYAAWHTYNQTKDFQLAIKVGLLTGATSYATSRVGTTLQDELVGRTIATASIGGAAVAAAGGDNREVLDGFLRAGAMVLIQDGYRQVTSGDLNQDLKAATKEPFCLSATSTCAQTPAFGEGGVKVIDHSTAVVGVESNPVPPENFFSKIGWTLGADNGPVMKTLSFAVPGANAVGLFHDQWVGSVPLSGVAIQATIVPAIVLIYNGTSAPLSSKIEEIAISDAKRKLLAPLEKPPTVDRDESRQILKFACASEANVRSIEVHIPIEVPQVQCAVVESSNGKASVPYYAKNDASYCRKQAEGIVEKLVASGWTCVSREDGARTALIHSIKSL